MWIEFSSSRVRAVEELTHPRTLTVVCRVVRVVGPLDVLVAHDAMMPWRVMLGEVVGQVELAWGPDEVELALVDSVLHPPVAHVVGF